VAARTSLSAITTATVAQCRLKYTAVLDPCARESSPPGEV